MKKLLAFALGATVAALGVSADTGVSKMICIDSDASLMWKTVTASTMPVALDWPEGAAKAVVTVDGVTKATVTDTSVPSVDVAFDLPTDARAEKVVTLAVSYLDGSDAELSSQAVNLGLVAGTAPGAVIPMRDVGTTAWNKLKAGAGVLPIPEKATELTIDQAVATGWTSPGWFYWTGVTPVLHELRLTADGVDYENDVRGSGGMFLLVR